MDPPAANIDRVSLLRQQRGRRSSHWCGAHSALLMSVDAAAGRGSARIDDGALDTTQETTIKSGLGIHLAA